MPNQFIPTTYNYLVKAVAQHSSEECLLWPFGLTHRNRYGACTFRGNTVAAHRLAFYCANGRWPSRARHTCPNPHCFNPRHIVEGRSEARNYRYLVKAVSEHHSEACLEWPFSRDTGGYGETYFNGKLHHCHRLAFRLVHGRFPEPCGLHSCDNPACFNPRHVFEGTHADNAADMHAKGRWTPGYSGHPGECNPWAKLTETLVQSLRADYKPGVFGYKRLAKKYGIDRNHAKRIVLGIKWKHVA